MDRSSREHTQHTDLVGLLDRRAALREAARRARALAGADVSLIGEIEDEGVAVLRSWAGTRNRGLHDLVIPSGLGLGGKVLATGRPCRVRNYARSRSITHHFDEPIGAEGIRAMLGVPVQRADRVLGVLYVARREHTSFGSGTVTALSEIADATAVALTVADRADRQREAEAAAERRRIAVALHDSVGAMLFTIGAQVRDLRTGYADDPALADRLGTVERRIAEAAEALRRSLAGLHDAPPDRSLSSAVAADCRAFEERTGVTSRALTLTDLPELDAPRRQILVAAVREALLNVEKHARASSVVVSLAATDGGVLAVITDDGVGWADHGEATSGASGAAGALPAGGIGLAALNDGLQRLGGTLRLIGNEDAGLTVRAWVPCP
ncbi:GAF domain-containing protein [Streptomyces sp. TP-A0356]|uniref:GAF domain-containing sensor histidine kinase n=1 Tax=Streptomyces sp. TP-A0356 TaxID=1359208 RepID=UPI0006E1E0C5|nr:GAF domain-containing protein [Streptomyces sp. TP-A0356]